QAPFAGVGTAADPIRVVAARPGTVQVRVADAPDESLTFLLVRETAGGIEKHPAIGTGVNVDASGVATFDGVPPGLWQLRLQRFGEAFVSDGAPHALAIVDVAAGASVVVPVDVRPMTPGWLATTVE